jgi:hypothetical protein
VSVKKYLRTIEVLVLGTYCGEDSPVVRGQVAQCARVQLHGAVADCMSEVDERERERVRSRSSRCICLERKLLRRESVAFFLSPVA